MTEFKVGDMVRVKEEYRTNRKPIGSGTFIANEGVVTELSSSASGIIRVNDKWVFKKCFELIPVGFEVGKTYTYKFNANEPNRYTVEFVSPITGAAHSYWTNRNGEKKASLLVEFANYTEVVPPPPEEWRIVYKNSCSDIVIGTIPFKSDDEARNSPHWYSGAFKTIRVDN